MSEKADKFAKLKNIKTPEISKNRQNASIEAAMLAFDIEAQKTAQKENSKNFQGNGLVHRLITIFNKNDRIFSMNKWIMDYKLPLGVAAVALIAFPVAWQLTSTSSLIGVKPDVILGEAKSKQELTSTSSNDVIGEAASNADFAPIQKQNLAKDTPAVTRFESDSVEGVSASPKMTRSLEMVALSPSPIPNLQDGDKFSDEAESSLFITAQNPVSTFSIDVDTASYSYVRRQLENGILPNSDAVRIEEMVNYFSYDYKTPQDENVPFSQSVEVYPTPWNEATRLLHIGIKGFMPEVSEIKPANLVFLIDSSGSMNAPDKLPLLIRSFTLLLNQLSENDTISIVAYAGSAGVVLEPTKANEKRKILKALESLNAGGSTAGGQGIELAYELAKEAKSKGSNNRVILATDGDFNVGLSSSEELKKFIEKKRDDGISLSVLGFGTGNYNDALMQTLAQNGNGNAYYIDNFKEAQKVLVEQVQGTLTTIAKDVKIQVEFNPNTVAEYRLVGYETRALKREDFNNDKVDAGDIGAGHTVTAIYEITPVGSSAISVDALRYTQEKPAVVSGNADEYAYLKLRYKLPDEDKSKLIELPISVNMAKDDIADISPEFRFGASVAAFGQKLKDSNYGNKISYEQIKALGQGAKGEDRFGYRAEFLSLVDLASSISGEK